MMPLRIAIGVIVVAIISAWAYYVDNRHSNDTEENNSDE